MSTPTLIIGLGGAGLEIIKRVHEKATDKQKRNIGFAVFDTDANELRKIEDAKAGIHTIQISTTLTVGEYLQQDDNAREKWFPVNQVLNSKLMTDGAGQVRAISRLAFNTALVQGKLEPLDEAIGELYRLNGERMEQAPRIIIAGSLCGGTGSGLSLPVSLYTRNYLETRVQHGASIVRGFFMLPETFFGVIKGNSERDNLRSNAYAALRELDAFMMKADGNLPKEYDLHFTIPRVNAREEDEYTGRPMDFCFLFDGQNMNGQNLASREEYLEHAANCIYSMAIAPTSSRSNSSEDNVIRDIMAQKGRNRYAGAGTSILVYPAKDVKRYLAMRWTNEIISNEWVKIDRAYMMEVENNRLRRNTGAPSLPLNRGKHYTDLIQASAQQNDPFGREIWRLCTEFEDGQNIVEKQPKALSYANALEGYILDQVGKEKESFRNIIAGLSENAEEAEKKQGKDLLDHIKAWNQMMVAWIRTTEQGTVHCAQMIAFSLFKDPSDFTEKQNEPYRLENWIRDKNGFIHPNAVRYFVYQAIQTLEIAQSLAAENVSTHRNNLIESQRNLFDVTGTTKVESMEEYFEIKKLGEKKTVWKKGTIESAVHEIKGRMAGLSSELDEMWTANTRLLVFTEALVYLKEIAKSFEVFYDVIERYGLTISDEISKLEKKYQTDDGKPVRNVCADGACLRAMGEEIVNKNNTMDLPSELNRKIYSELRKVAMQNIRQKMKGRDAKDSKDKPLTTNQFCITIFNETIVKHMEQEIEDEYDARVNMDVLTALEQEAVYRKSGEEITESEMKDYIKHYMEDVIQSTERLASPFIETPRYKQNRDVNTCTYSSDLVAPNSPMARWTDFIHKNLPNGVVSDDVEPSMILFYKAVYAIEAKDLGKFAPPEVTSTTNRPAGDYYKAYHSLISKLHPDTQSSRKITPHIDRWWHLVTKTPELSELAQYQQKKDIMRALVWSLLGRYIKFYKDKKNPDRQYYKRSSAQISIEGETETKLIVSNGTVCDQLYEVQDALTIYPELIYAILEKVDKQIRQDTDNGYNMALEDTFLYECLAEFKLDEFPLKKEVTKEDGKTVTVKNSVRSIFELPLVLKRSVLASEYNNSDMVLLIDTIIEELRNYHVIMFEKDDPNDMIKAYDGLLLSQFRLMQENIRIEAQTVKEEADKKHVTLNSDIESDVLIDELIERLVKEILEHGYAKDAKEIKKALNKQDDDD